MRPTEQLKEEHEGILLMLKILGKICSRLDNQEKVDPVHLERIMEFFRIFADKCHHGKEEEILFPEMEKYGIPKENGPIGVMIFEHNQGRTYVKEMSDAVQRYQKGDSSASLEFINNARNYITLLSQHINKENDILFPMGEKVIPEIRKRELKEAFEKVEDEKIGVGTHEAFHNLLHQLMEVYK